MNANFRNLAIWVIVLLLIVALFNVFSRQTTSKAGTDISYSDFRAAVDAGQVKSVEISGRRITGTMKTDNIDRRFQVYTPDDPGIVDNP